MTVFLVGAGPGDPGLLTIRGAELLARADAVLYDRLIPESALALCRDDAELVYVGKQGGGPQMPQAEIDALLVDHGTRFETVVRLKGGDPFVFGRGGEEVQVLLQAGIAVEVVPGVTSGVAAPAYAGIPVTHREAASAVAFVTGHPGAGKGEDAIDWPSLAAFPGTLVFYMGVKRLPAIAAGLIEAGRAADEPAAVIERGTFPDQRTIVAPLAELPALAEAEAIRAPAITIVGAVAGLRDRLAWFERRPLHGVSVAVTRARAQASGLAASLRELGAAVVETPAIRTVALDPALPDLAPYDLVVVSSPNGAHELFRVLHAAGLDARALAARTVAAMGPGTARALLEHGIAADVVPARSVAEGLVDALAGVGVRRALIARGAEGRDVLVDALRERGAVVDLLALYETVAEPLGDEALAEIAASSYVTFTSASTVRHLAHAAGGALPAGPRLASIGPATSAELREHGREPDVEADPHTPDGLVAALVADAARSRAD